ncbi:hypothetical protein [Salmonirosea aquatica]|uniref:Uncharacterized protein n=1 Tax=Salmonirosea aquatica TaxID=2654236 RepID=A0A7C9BCU3_9BACT|nr:hypothetical protein [Cytophagaceae bacterium SJW1-29]
MKTKSVRYLAIALLALAGCKPEKDGVFYLDPMPVFEEKKGSPLASDSINAYRPVIGAANVERAFPFGTVNEPVGVRLLEVIEKVTNSITNPSERYNDKTIYEYGASGNLVKKIRQTTKGMIWDINTYEPNAEGKIQIATKVNTGIDYFRGELNELSLFGNTLYESTDEDFSWGLKSFQRYYSNNQNSPIERTRLGFDAKGQLVWEEGIYLDAASSRITSYKLYKRDANGNATFTRYVNGNYPITEHKMTYDDKPNPYRTTGDILLPEVTNSNNILTQQIIENGVITTFRYEYEYRPNGYPSRVQTYKNEELISTREFQYNQ